MYLSMMEAAMVCAVFVGRVFTGTSLGLGVLVEDDPHFSS